MQHTRLHVLQRVPITFQRKFSIFQLVLWQVGPDPKEEQRGSLCTDCVLIGMHVLLFRKKCGSISNCREELQMGFDASHWPFMLEDEELLPMPMASFEGKRLQNCLWPIKYMVQLPLMGSC